MEGQKIKQEDGNCDLENNDSKNVLSQCRFELRNFSLNHILHWSKHPRVSTHQDLFQLLFFIKITFASSYRKM